jgi:septum formation topological specificity factor MinE
MGMYEGFQMRNDVKQGLRGILAQTRIARQTREQVPELRLSITVTP